VVREIESQRNNPEVPAAGANGREPDAARAPAALD